MRTIPPCSTSRSFFARCGAPRVGGRWRFRIQVMQQTWDASLYAGNGRFVALLAESLVEALQPQPGERILDLGCGDGFLTRRIAESGATVVGVDNSPQMIAAAKKRGPDARHVSGEELSFDLTFA